VLLVLLLLSVATAADAQYQVACNPCEMTSVLRAVRVGTAVLDHLIADASYVPGPADVPTADLRGFGMELEDLDSQRCGCRLKQIGGGIDQKSLEGYLTGGSQFDGTCTLRNVVAGLRLTHGAVFPSSAQRFALAPGPGVSVTDPKSGRKEFVAGPLDPVRLRAARRLLGQVVEQCSN